MSREIDKEPNTKKKYLLFLRRESKCRSIDKVYYSKPDSKLQSKLLIRLFGLEEKEIRKNKAFILCGITSKPANQEKDVLSALTRQKSFT